MEHKDWFMRPLAGETNYEVCYDDLVIGYIRPVLEDNRQHICWWYRLSRRNWERCGPSAHETASCLVSLYLLNVRQAKLKRAEERVKAALTKICAELDMGDVGLLAVDLTTNHFITAYESALDDGKVSNE